MAWQITSGPEDHQIQWLPNDYAGVKGKCGSLHESKEREDIVKGCFSFTEDNVWMNTIIYDWIIWILFGGVFN